jgi:hypothetical protein
MGVDWSWNSKWTIMNWDKRRKSVS